MRTAEGGIWILLLPLRLYITLIIVAAGWREPRECGSYSQIRVDRFTKSISFASGAFGEHFKSLKIPLRNAKGEFLMKKDLTGAIRPNEAAQRS